jgi:hypothetical protein
MIAITSSALSFGNENTTIVLHGQDWSQGHSCHAWVGTVDCEGLRPTVSIESGQQALVTVFLRNYEDVAGVYYRFAVDGGSGSTTWGDWTILFASAGDCGLTNQTTSWIPNPADGNLATNFNCITGGTFQPVVYLVFAAVGTGCLGVEESDLGPSGVLSCPPLEVLTSVAAENRGRVCVGPGGYDACDPVVTPVRPTTWGNIRNQYGR